MTHKISIISKEYEKILTHGEEGYPEEVCGVLIGNINDNTSFVIEARMLTNITSKSKQVSFFIDPLELIKLEDELEIKKLDMVGIYHSHPNHPAKPSETDYKYAWPNLSYVILSVENGKAKSLTSWRLNGGKDKKEFIEESVIIK